MHAILFNTTGIKIVALLEPGETLKLKTVFFESLVIPENKKHLKGKIFDSNSEVEQVLISIIGDIEENEFIQAIQNGLYG